MKRSSGAGNSRPTNKYRRAFAGVLGVFVLAVGAISSCSSGEDPAGTAAVFESERSRPTESLEHDHSGESSALAPETVLPADIAALGDGVGEGESMDLWVGVNICGRFVEFPGDTGGDAPSSMSIDGTGMLTVAPEKGDPAGHEVRAQSVAELLDIDLSTGQLDFGDSWEGQSIGLGDQSMELGAGTLATGDPCGLGPEPELAEVQLWYYTPLAVESGEQVRVVVTDPQEVPLVEGGSAVTIAFAPVSSLPTLPPAALVG